MKTHLVVREYARLTTAALSNPSLDAAQISVSAFDWLCELAGKYRSSGAQLLQLDGRQWLRLDNFVGILESPCGLVIEILPKLHTEEHTIPQSRALLCKLIASALQLPARSADAASLALYQTSLSEWLMQQFLQALEHLLKRGMRFEYQRVEEEQRFLRGQLDVVKQMRQPAGRQHCFQIRHDVYLPDRPENRLLKSALQLVATAARQPDNWWLAHELLAFLQDVPASHDYAADFSVWRHDRLLAHYQPVKPWCELILYRQMPMAGNGDYRGISLLFPMERLFESYVAMQLASAVRRLGDPTAQLQTQLASKSLCQHLQQPLFRLKPDLALQAGDRQWVLDTKWKLLDAADRGNKYHLSQQDFYQMFAYGHSYLAGQGALVLIYPAWQKFPATTALAGFHYSQTLDLWVLPFDLNADDAGAQLLSQLQQLPHPPAQQLAQDLRAL